MGVVLGTVQRLGRGPRPVPVEVKGTSVSAALKRDLPLREFHSNTYACQAPDSIHAASTIPNSLVRSGAPVRVAERRVCPAGHRRHSA